MVSLETGESQQYKMKVMSELLVQARILNLDIEEFVGFFATQVQAMLASPPNYNKFGERARVWIMRGFYPDTDIFFKLVLMNNSHSDSGPRGYYAKVSPLRVLFKQHDSYVVFDGTKLNEDITNRMENSLFGAKHELNPILKNKPKMPRCMSPRGLKIFRYKAPRRVKRAMKKGI